MNPNDFCYWLHGWSEINGGAPPSATQWQVINDHLDLVFNKVTPNRSKSSPRPFLAIRTDGAIVSGTTDRSSVVGTGYPMSFSGLSGLSYSWEESLRRDNHDKIFITISREPIYRPSASYSYYPATTGECTTAHLLCAHGVDFKDYSKTYLVIDNVLKPTKSTYADNLRGSSKHLTCLPNNGTPGIVNVGIGPPLIC